LSVKQERKDELLSLLRARSEIFNIDAKESCAITFGQPIDAFYHMPYDVWCFQSERLREFYDAMLRDVAEVEDWCGQKLVDVSYDRWLHIYRDFLSEL
jgi:hypothetical protein